jgi:hypothetical protein
MRMILVAALFAASTAPVSAGEGAWVAFVRDGDNSVAFERSSVTGSSVNLLSVAPKSTVNGMTLTWDIKAQVHEFDCAANRYRMTTKILYDKSGKQSSDDTYIVTAMNKSFPDRMHPINTDALRKAHALVCGKTEPAPAKPFGSMAEALTWMAN